MSGRTSRRGFLWGVAAAGGGLLAQRASEATPRVQTTQSQPGTTHPDTSDLVHQRPKIGRNALITVVTQPTSRDVNPRAGSWIYIKEILQRAGLFFVERAPQDLPALDW